MIILVEDILLCLKYIKRIKLNIYSAWHKYMFIVIIIIIIITVEQCLCLFYYYNNRIGGARWRSG